MPLEIKTLMASNAALALFIASALLFYKINQRTYPGYGFWLTSTFIIAIGYVFMIFRELMPLWLSIIMANATIVLAGVVRLDGVLRFTRNDKLKKNYYILPILIIPIVMYFYVVNDDIIMRNLSMSILVGVMVLIAGSEFFKNRTKENTNLYMATAILYWIYGLLLFIRAILWFFNPQDSLFIAGVMQQLYFLIITVFEVGLGVTFLMMNSQRLEAELLASRDNLQATVNKLEDARSKVKTLSGIIPICMHCKEIRDDQGYWNRIEKFISENSEVEFSHGICPKCIKEKYPDILD